MRTSDAETLALRALAYLAADSEILARFLTISGLEPDNLRQRLTDPELLGGVIEFLLSDENLCAEFLTAEGLDPRNLHAALQALSGTQPDGP